MYILYVDESGDPNNPDDEYFFLGGVAAFERQTFHLSQDFDNLQDEFFPTSSEQIEIHAQAINDKIIQRFDQLNNNLYGLTHLVRDYRNCWCQACASRRARN